MALIVSEELDKELFKKLDEIVKSEIKKKDKGTFSYETDFYVLSDKQKKTIIDKCGLYLKELKPKDKNQILSKLISKFSPTTDEYISYLEERVNEYFDNLVNQENQKKKLEDWEVENGL